MTRLTIELDDYAAEVAIEKARQANLTLSEWLADHIVGASRKQFAGERDAMGYPIGWFERTFGSLADVEDFCEPADPPPPPISPLDL